MPGHDYKPPTPSLGPPPPVQPPDVNRYRRNVQAKNEPRIPPPIYHGANSLQAKQDHMRKALLHAGVIQRAEQLDIEEGQWENVEEPRRPVRTRRPPDKFQQAEIARQKRKKKRKKPVQEEEKDTTEELPSGTLRKKIRKREQGSRTKKRPQQPALPGLTGNPIRCDLLATWLHSKAGGNLSRSTTGVARLQNGNYLVATQLSLDKLQNAVNRLPINVRNRIMDVVHTRGAGVHCEVELYLRREELVNPGNFAAIGASQGFCPHCLAFLTHHNIVREGSPRKTTDAHVWVSPELLFNREQSAGNYPYLKGNTNSGQVRSFDTRAELEQFFNDGGRILVQGRVVSTVNQARGV